MPDRILAIELSTATASVALWEDGRDLDGREWQTGRDHASLFAHLGGILDRWGREPIDTIIVGSGPGSYGGVRVALAAADGLSLALGARTVALSSWEALLDEAPATACVIANARRNGWVTGRLDQGRIDGQWIIVPQEDLACWLAERAGEGVPVYSTESADLIKGEGLASVQAGAAPSARLLIKAWLAKTSEERERLLSVPPAPVYVRPPHITLAKTPAWMIRR